MRNKTKYKNSFPPRGLTSLNTFSIFSLPSRAGGQRMAAASSSHILFSTLSSLEGDLLSVFSSYRRQELLQHESFPWDAVPPELIQDWSLLNGRVLQELTVPAWVSHGVHWGSCIYLSKPYNNHANSTHNEFTLHSSVGWIIWYFCNEF